LEGSFINLQHPNQTLKNTYHSTAIMAEGGIDRKAEERMEFETSKDVSVAPTFVESPFLLSFFSTAC
jgi:hypothetical protein